MDKNKMSNLLGEFLYGVRKNETELAIQLFIEGIVVPDNCESYSKEEIKKFISEYLESK